MCRTITSLLQTLVCILQMLVRIFMTLVLMIENLIRLIMQTVYNLLSFVTQTLSLLPICLVFIVTSKLKFLICGGGSGGVTGVTKNSTCECAISTLMVVVVFLIFRETGVLDKIMVKMGYIPTKGLKERLKKVKINVPNDWTMPPDWKMLRSGNESGGYDSGDNETVTYDWMKDEVSEMTTMMATNPPTPPRPLPLPRALMPVTPSDVGAAAENRTSNFTTLSPDSSGNWTTEFYYVVR